MIEPQVYNLDDVAEYFEFKAKGHIYRFRYMTGDESKKFAETEKTGDAIQDYVFSFITKTEETAPEFKEVFPTLNIPQQNMFWKMLSTQFEFDANK